MFCAIWYRLLRFKKIVENTRGGVLQKDPPTSSSSVTSPNVGISPQNFLTFSFNPFATLV